MGKLSTYRQKLNQFFTKVGQDIKELRDSKISRNDGVGGYNYLTRSMIGQNAIGNFNTEKYAVSGAVSGEKTQTTSGLRFSSAYLGLLPTRLYTMSFLIRKTSGTFLRIGGHVDTVFDYVEHTVDGVDVGGHWANPNIVATLDDGQWHEVVLVFRVNSNSAGFLYIQPNRVLTTLMAFEIDNLKIEEGPLKTPFTLNPIDAQSDFNQTDMSAPGFIKNSNSSNWNDAYSWGDHALAGYLVSSDLNGYATTVEINNIYDQLSAKANTRLSNVVSDLSDVEKSALKEKIEAASINGDNTTGGTWQIEKAQNAQVGDVFDSRMISVQGDLGIDVTPVITDTLALVFGGLSAKPFLISENGYDNFIYKVGEATGYPNHVKKGNYIVESKNRYRSTFIDTLSETDGAVGKVIINPFNGIEHQYYEVEITDTLTELEILLEQPTKDEFSGNQIHRNAHGQKVTISIFDLPPGISSLTFIGTFLKRVPSNLDRGIYTFYYDAEAGMWDFGGNQQF